MTNSRFEHDGDTDAVTVAGNILEQGEVEIADACRTILMRLYEPDDAPGKTWFRGYFNVTDRENLVRQAAFAAIAVLLESRNMDLPLGIETAYTIPEAKP